MEKFLDDYGLVWVGESVSKEDESQVLDNFLSQEESDREDLRSDKAPFQVNFDLILKNIQELNIIAGEGTPKLHHTRSGAVTFKDPTSLQLTLYSNGVMLNSGPFRPLTDSSTCCFLQDIMDGFFPSELQERHPDGIPFQVIDKRSIMFMSKQAKVKAFSGRGRRLGDSGASSTKSPTTVETLPCGDNESEIKSKPYHAIMSRAKAIEESLEEDRKEIEDSRSLSRQRSQNSFGSSCQELPKISNLSKTSSNTSNNVSWTETSTVFRQKTWKLHDSSTCPELTFELKNPSRTECEPPGRKMSLEQFLSKLPTSVVKNGRVIDIRNSLHDMLKSTTIPPKTHIIDSFPSSTKDGSEVRVEIKIRSEDGSEVYSLTFPETATIRDVRRALDEHRPNLKHHYVIMWGHPPRPSINDVQLIDVCGRFKRALFILKSVDPDLDRRSQS